MKTVELKDRYVVVADSKMGETLQLAQRAARADAPVLICGESGTGKELVARYIHENSSRREAHFVSINCAALPEGLIEAELFGYEKGAFTGAIQQRIGKFEKANQGTLLLDEVSEMPVHLQSKLLRVLQEGEIDRIGSHHSLRVQTRIIATTNQDPNKLIREGKFRPDLFYRLNVLRIDCPPLRGRKEAIACLAKEFLLRSPHLLEQRSCRLSAGAMEKLVTYAWPGNIRELQNVIERAVINGEGNVIEEQDIHLLMAEPAASFELLGEMEENQIKFILSTTQGNKTLAARKLGISVRTLRNKLKSYDV